jgi:hypothetical protein
VFEFDRHGSAGKDMKNCSKAAFDKLLHRDLIDASQYCFS